MGVTLQKSLIVKNTGTSDLIVSGVDIAGTNSAEFSATVCSQPISSGNTCTITVSLTPTSYGKKIAQLTISSNSYKKSTLMVKLSGNALPPKISISPRSLNFGRVKSNPTPAPSRTITLKNTGVSDLTINSISLQGDSSFTVDGNGCSTLAKNEKCTIIVTFDPSTTGQKTGQINIGSNATSTPMTVKLKGQAFTKGSAITIETLPGSELVEFPKRMRASDDGYLYIGTQWAVVKFNKQGGLKRTIVGNLRVGDWWSGGGLIENLFDLYTVGDYVYAGTSFRGKIFKAYTGEDSLGSVNIFIHHRIFEGMINEPEIAGNSAKLFYWSDGGIYEKTYDGIDLPKQVLNLPRVYGGAVDGLRSLLATDNELFIKVNNGSDNKLFRFDLATQQLSTVVDLNGIYTPMTLHGSTLYWVSGSSLYSMEVNSGSAKLIASDFGPYKGNTDENQFRLIAAGDEYVFLVGAATTGYNPPAAIYRVSIDSGNVDMIYSTTQYITSIATVNNRLYFVTVNPYTQLNTFSDSWDPVQLFDSSTEPDLGSGYVYDFQLTPGNGKVFLKTGAKILAYDIASNSYDIVFPIGQRLGSFYESGGTLYVVGAAGESCIISIPVDRQIRQPQTLNSELMSLFPAMGVRSTVIDQDNIYWIWEDYSDSQHSVYHISKIAMDGSAYEELFVSDGELRDISIYNGELWFTCNGTCGVPGWVLASMPASGGQPTPVWTLLASPITFIKDEIFYVFDTSNFMNRSLFAINMEQNNYVELLSNLYEPVNAVYLDKSNRWLYIGQDAGMAMKISRFEIISWDEIGKEQIIVFAAFEETANLNIGTITTDGNYMYYYDGGIKKVAE
jgi:hypothetical protein